MRMIVKSVIKGIAWLIAGAVFLHYVFYQWGYALNSDNALMVEYARRWLSGGVYGIDVFDPNPPANFILYLPVVYLAKLMPVWHALTLYTSVLLVSSALCVRALLGHCDIDKPGRDLILFSYVFGNIFLGNIFYGERDHLILLALFPFILLQYGLLKGEPLKSPLQWGVLLTGAALVLVKPHYGLMPVSMILYRAARQHRFKALLGPDTIALTVLCCAYGALLLWAFPVYLHEIVPLAAKIYAPDADMLRLAVNVLILSVGFLFWAFYISYETDKSSSALILLLLIFSACLCIAALSQLKGYYYHALPQFIVLYVMASFILYQFVRKVMCEYALPLTALFCLMCAYIFMPPARDYLTHYEFKATAMGQLYKDCQPPCPVFIFDRYPDIAVKASFFIEGILASRFPYFWLLPEIVGPGNPPQKSAFLQMVAEDLGRYKPVVLALLRTEVTDATGHKMSFDFVDFFSENPQFSAAMRAYEKSGTFSLNRHDYHRSTTLGYESVETFDLYRLRTPQ